MKEMTVIVTDAALAVQTFVRDIDSADMTFAVDFTDAFSAFTAQAVVNRVKAKDKVALVSFTREQFNAGAYGEPTNSVDVAALVDEFPADVVYIKNLTTKSLDIFTDASTEPLGCGAVMIIEEHGRSFSVVHAPSETVDKILGAA